MLGERLAEGVQRDAGLDADQARVPVGVSNAPIRSRLSSVPSVSTAAVNEWPDPATRTARPAAAARSTALTTSPTAAGRSTVAGWHR